jgi:hypothetical protein
MIWKMGAGGRHWRVHGHQNQKAACGKAAGGFEIDHHEEVEAASVLGRPGSDLLFQVLRLSTIGAGKFYGRVRDGIGYRLPANTTRPAKDGFASQAGAFVTFIPDQTFDRANAH